jgi:quercetin dioxygenase-like cupin family protein
MRGDPCRPGEIRAAARLVQQWQLERLVRDLIRRVIMRTVSLSACLLVWAVALHAQSGYTTEPAKADAAKADAAKLTWGPAPTAFPAGAKMAVVSGDPGKAEEFTVDLSLPNDYRIPPHFHPTDESVTVKKGTFLVGMGDTLDLAKTNAMKAGATGTIPAGHHHYAATKGAAVVEVTAMGPFAMTYVNAADDPRNKAHQ